MTENISDPDYERDAYGLLNERAPEHATIESLLGIAYKLRTANLLAAANLLALDRLPGLMLRNGMLGGGGDELLAKLSTQIPGRLGPEEECPRITTPPDRRTS